ncbi:MAG: hypothetical protein ACLFV5_12715, partial [Anaerolineales bacterium]
FRFAKLLKKLLRSFSIRRVLVLRMRRRRSTPGARRLGAGLQAEHVPVFRRLKPARKAFRPIVRYVATTTPRRRVTLKGRPTLHASEKQG